MIYDTTMYDMISILSIHIFYIHKKKQNIMHHNIYIILYCYYMILFSVPIVYLMSCYILCTFYDFYVHSILCTLLNNVKTPSKHPIFWSVSKGSTFLPPINGVATMFPPVQVQHLSNRMLVGWGIFLKTSRRKICRCWCRCLIETWTIQISLLSLQTVPTDH